MIVQKLNFTVDINSIRQYYSKVASEFNHLRWSWDSCGDTIVKQWKDAAYTDPANLLTQGWAIQSNLKDITIPCPPWNISIHETVEYRNTDLAFGIITQLQNIIPYGYRWSISLQPPGGKVSKHSDHADELTVWIPIYTKGPAITFVENNIEAHFNLQADGSTYLLNTTIPHYTLNNSQDTRITIIFRINKAYEQKIKSLTDQRLGL